MKASDQAQPRQNWTVALRRRSARMVQGRPEGGWTGEYEVICCVCGDSPDRDYREVPAALQRIRGPYPVAAAVTAYVEHDLRHSRTQPSPAVRDMAS
jgi:hypothetical protein